MDQSDYIKVQIFTMANTTASKMKNPKVAWKTYLLTCDNVLCSSICKKIMYQYKKDEKPNRKGGKVTSSSLTEK